MGGVGGCHSHNKGNSNSGNGGSRGRPYGVMLVLAFGAALLGVMILHKLRERRVFNLLLKDKDSELLSIHILLQKERERVEEAIRKNEEMKAKLYSLRNQKMEHDRRLLEMQSTIDSLKDEQRAMEVTMEEKQNEIKLLRLKEVVTETENSQLAGLMERLKQKDAEIEDLRNRLQQYPVKMSSEDDPSNPSVNPTVTRNVVGKEETAEGDENVVYTGEKLEKSQDQSNENGGSSRGEKQGQGKKDGGFKDGSDDKNIDANETITYSGGKNIEENGELGKLENSQGEGRELVESSNGGMKSYRRENSESNTRPMKSGKHGSFTDMKGKRWRLIAKSRKLENRNFKTNGVTGMRARKFFQDDQGGLKGRTKAAPSKEGTGKNDHQVEIAEVVNSTAIKDHDDATDRQQSRDIDRKETQMNGVSEDMDADSKEPGKHAGDHYVFSKSSATSEEDEEYKNEIDEPAF